MSNPLVVAGVCVVTQGQHPLNLPFNGGVESFVRCGWSGEDVYPTGDGSHTGYLNLNDEILRVGFAKTWTPCLLIGLHLRDPWNPGVSYSSVFHWVRGVYIFFIVLSVFFGWNSWDFFVSVVWIQFWLLYVWIFPCWILSPKKTPSVDCLCSWDGGGHQPATCSSEAFTKTKWFGKRRPGCLALVAGGEFPLFFGGWRTWRHIAFDSCSSCRKFSNNRAET